jgi:hypothetical protein
MAEQAPFKRKVGGSSPPGGIARPPAKAAASGRCGRALALGEEHRVEQAREARIEVVGAQGEQTLSPVEASPDQAGFAQDAEVMGQGRLREPELEHAARGLVSVSQPANDLEPGGVTQGVQDAR